MEADGSAGPLTTRMPPGVLGSQQDVDSERGRTPPMSSARSAGEQQGPNQPGYLVNNTKADYLKRLRRIEGQARGLQRMVEEEQYCIDILTQVSAMTKALQSVALGLLDEHMGHCVADAAREGGHQAEIKLKEASDAIARLVRS